MPTTTELLEPASTAPQDTKQPSKDDRERQQHLETIVRNGINACNERNFNITSPPWTNFSNDFKVEQIQMAPAEGSKKDNPEPMNLTDLLNFQQDIASKDPGYHYKILELTTVAFDNKSGRAEVMMNAEAHGIPEGVVRPIVEVFEFRRKEGRWQCTRLKCMSGVDHD